MYLIYSTVALILGFCLDLILGDPHGMWHPVISIGKLISRTEKGRRSRSLASFRGEFWGGVMTVIIVAGTATVVPLAILMIGYHFHWLLGLLLESIMCYFILATKSLKTESMKVAAALEQFGLEKGRQAVAMIVGRDTKELTKEGVVKAAVETVAENTSDGIVAPMLYMAIGGPVLGFLYKAINTMDSMLGYKSPRYLYFGRAAAKTDDAVNYLPARLSAWLMIVAAVLCGYNGRDSLRIYRRDCRNHESPNSAQTEAVMAGALGIQLAGDAWYFGQKHQKPTIGDFGREVEIADIKRANRLLYATAVIALLLFTAVKLLLMISI